MSGGNVSRYAIVVVCLCAFAFQRIAARARNECAALRVELAAQKTPAQKAPIVEHNDQHDDGWQRYAPRSLGGWASCEDALKQWDYLYSKQIANSDEMTRSGFRSPVTAKKSTLGFGGVELETSGLGEIEWSKPIGFALVDCDNNVRMIDKTEPLKLSISWDAKRKCLQATQVAR